ncbi:hypothetical protein VOLCADRAFT_98685 [Volvox carteri f. nagariensis]|uniref:Uncharacterized protein n=1 Tax=Volvox carteri f. nagariensis TaxID=3068 RepID=D8UG05_VOLCA|nr:uncharacterized protein VOLCADRAFT_98685 [Volvox carteri f. nagariensis]EFJ41369.1 hypothetical protein VOLCADRAFT_98685 [Volvox carteri f. nagariensis]|eukprot:XP_002957599.1 hypothetical protein VOLCADRAFT_98685 [Volvox carteri f. nagariensis]
MIAELAAGPKTSGMRKRRCGAKLLVTGNVVVPNESEEQKLLRAKGYPYARPETSFLFVRGEVLEFDNDQWQGLNHLPDIVGRCGSLASQFSAERGVDLVGLSREELFWPVLAIGSNAGPEQLRRKYPPQDFPDCVIPVGGWSGKVIQVALEDFDVVYTPYIATYGSCTATLEHSPGTVTSIFITYLTGPLMQRMHATEGGYNLCRLSGLRLHVAPRPGPAPVYTPDKGDSGGLYGGKARANSVAVETVDKQVAALSSFEVRDWVYQYNHKQGCIKLPLEGLAGSPVAIAAIPAKQRIFPAANQVEMLSALKALLGPTDAGSLASGDVVTLVCI